jgi:bifunctional non-homologous end joining protein LigD
VTSGERIGRGEEVRLTNLDEPLFDGGEATKRDLVSYLEAVGEQLLGELRDRPLSVIRALRGQKPFMQKNVPKYAPPWLRTVKIWLSRRCDAPASRSDFRTRLGRPC